MDEHESQIESRNAAIEDLAMQVAQFKSELITERAALASKQEQNSKLQESHDKLATRLRNSTNKYSFIHVS